MFKRSLLFASLWAVICGIIPAAAASDEHAVLMAAQPTVSPDGSYVVFVQQGDLWKVSSDGGLAARLTVNDGDDSQPHFSPDGKQLAFISDRTGSDQVFVMSADGGLPEQLTFHTEGY